MRHQYALVDRGQAGGRDDRGVRLLHRGADVVVLRGALEPVVEAVADRHLDRRGVQQVLQPRTRSGQLGRDDGRARARRPGPAAARPRGRGWHRRSGSAPAARRTAVPTGSPCRARPAAGRSTGSPARRRRPAAPWPRARSRGARPTRSRRRGRRRDGARTPCARACRAWRSCDGCSWFSGSALRVRRSVTVIDTGPVRVAVVGAGISGIACARAARGRRARGRRPGPRAGTGGSAGQPPVRREVRRPGGVVLHRRRPGVRGGRGRLGATGPGAAVDDDVRRARRDRLAAAEDRPGALGCSRWVAVPGRRSRRGARGPAAGARRAASARGRWWTGRRTTRSCSRCPTRRRCAVLCDDGATALLAGRAWDPVLVLAARWAERAWDWDGAFLNGNEVLEWVADDGARRGDGAPVLTAHSTPAFASTRLAVPADAATELVAALVRLGLPEPAEVLRVQRWTYAKPVGTRGALWGLTAAGWGSAATAGARPRCRPRGCPAPGSGRPGALALRASEPRVRSTREGWLLITASTPEVEHVVDVLLGVDGPAVQPDRPRRGPAARSPGWALRIFRSGPARLIRVGRAPSR